MEPAPKSPCQPAVGENEKRTIDEVETDLSCGFVYDSGIHPIFEMCASEVVAQAHRVVRMRRKSPSTRHLLLIGCALWEPDTHRNSSAACRERGQAIGLSTAGQGALRPLITHVTRQASSQRISRHALAFSSCMPIPTCMAMAAIRHKHT